MTPAAPAAATIREIVPPHTARAFEAMRALRGGWDSEAEFVRRVDGVQRGEGYRLVGAFEGDLRRAVAVAGFRVGHSLAWGRYVYVDDLSTLSDARGRGHARRLLEWLAGEARRVGCDQLHLDSGFGPERADAHRLYLNAGLRVSSLHFARRL